MYMLYIRDPPQNKRFTQAESEGMEKTYPMQMKIKKSWSSNTYVWQNRLQNKDHKKRQTRSLHNTKEINPIRGYNQDQSRFKWHRD